MSPLTIAAMNLCPCGYYGDQVRRGPPRSAECTCSNSMVSRYQKRIFGPLLDRSAKLPLGCTVDPCVDNDWLTA